MTGRRFRIRRTLIVGLAIVALAITTLLTCGAEHEHHGEARMPMARPEELFGPVGDVELGLGLLVVAIGIALGFRRAP